MKLSGLEALHILPDSNFINVGERTNVAGSKKFLRYIQKGRPLNSVSLFNFMADIKKINSRIIRL